MNLLFICSKNRLRSPTAEMIFNDYEEISAVSCGINKDSPTALSGDLMEWADHVFVMEKIHYKKVMQSYSKLLKDTPLTKLGIPDKYEFMQSELIDILEQRVNKHLDL